MYPGSFASSFFFGGGFGVVFLIMFVLIVGAFVVTAVRGVGQWNRNNHSPRLTMPAAVMSKRTQVTHHAHANGAGGSSTWYYATFQVESGDRLELALSGQEYGMLAEGDSGTLTFQGTRFLSFER